MSDEAKKKREKNKKVSLVLMKRSKRATKDGLLRGTRGDNDQMERSTPPDTQCFKKSVSEKGEGLEGKKRKGKVWIKGWLGGRAS